MKFSLPGLCGLALLAASPAHAGLTFDFQDYGSNKTLSSTVAFSAKVGSSYVTADQITATGTADLYAKSRGGDEVGLGLNNDPSGDHEITPGNHIDFNFKALKSDFTITSIDLNLGSVTPPDKYEIDGVSVGGVATMLGSGTVDGVFHLTAAEVASYDTFRVVGVAGNVLVDTITVNGAVPEPASLAMMALGLGAAATGFRLGRRKAIAA